MTQSSESWCRAQFVSIFLYSFGLYAVAVGVVALHRWRESLTAVELLDVLALILLYSSWPPYCRV